MSCDVCPFCGKTYKRLKSHLPHCKAAPSSKTPPARNDTAAKRTSSSQLASTESAAGGGKAKQSLPVAAKTQSKNSKKVSPASSASPASPASPRSLTPAAQSQSGNPSSSSQSLSLSSASSSSSSTKKKKQKLSDQIKAATASSSTSTLLVSTQSPPVSPTSSKPKKKSVCALIEDAESNRVSVGQPEGSVSDLSLADPGSFRTKTQTETKSNPDKDNTGSIFLSTDIKPNAVSEVKVPQTRKAAQSTSAASVNLDAKVNESRDNFLVKTKRETEDLSVNHLITKAGSGHQARITLQDVKATLGRVNKSRQSRNSSILSQFECSGSGSEIRSGAGLSLFSLPAGNQGDQFTGVSSQPSELQRVQTNNSKQQFPARLLLPGHLSPQVSQATPPPPHAVDMNEALHTISPILSHFCSYHPLPVGPHMLPEKAEPPRADDELTKANPGSRKHNAGDRGSEGSLAQQRLAQVRLKELPEWLAGRTPHHPRELVEMLHKGWQWYYRRYIDVKKGGVGGLSMLLAGYCVLSYIWSYPHLKQDRWRKHH